MKRDFDGKTLGFVCTPPALAEFMLRLRRNKGRVLDPACGAGLGAFETGAPDIVGVELSAERGSRGVLMDFFAYPASEVFDTILCNPPYVRAQDIAPSTRALLTSSRIDARGNLYLHFIEKCAQHLPPGGELIFVNPIEFLKSTSAGKLNDWLLNTGAITHFFDLSGVRVFDGATPDVAVWRYVKGVKQRQVCTPRRKSLVASNGAIAFTSSQNPVLLGDIAKISVGAVTGADAIFSHPDGVDFVCSDTKKTGKTRKLLYPGVAPHPALAPHRAALLARKIRSFDATNWWHWGRGFPHTDAPRIYVNAKTRHAKPFFLSDCSAFDGGVLAIFPHRTDACSALCDALNAVDWQDTGYRRKDGRCVFGQRSLANAPLPDTFKKFLP